MCVKSHLKVKLIITFLKLEQCWYYSCWTLPNEEFQLEDHNKVYKYNKRGLTLNAHTIGYLYNKILLTNSLALIPTTTHTGLWILISHYNRLSPPDTTSCHRRPELQSWTTTCHLPLPSSTIICCHLAGCHETGVQVAGLCAGVGGGQLPRCHGCHLTPTHGGQRRLQRAWRTHGRRRAGE